MKSLIFIVSVLLTYGAVPDALRAQRVPVDEAAARINKHIATIQQREEPMDRLYDGQQATQTFQVEVKKDSARDHRDYSSFDANSNLLRWKWGSGDPNGQAYYTGHAQALRDSLDVIKAEGFALAGDLEYLDKGMAQWAQHEPDVEKGMTEYVVYLATHDVLDQLSATPHCPTSDCPSYNKSRDYLWFTAIKPHGQSSGEGEDIPQ